MSNLFLKYQKIVIPSASEESLKGDVAQYKGFLPLVEMTKNIFFFLSSIKSLTTTFL